MGYIAEALYIFSAIRPIVILTGEIFVIVTYNLDKINGIFFIKIVRN